MDVSLSRVNQRDILYCYFFVFLRFFIVSLMMRYVIINECQLYNILNVFKSGGSINLLNLYGLVSESLTVTVVMSACDTCIPF